jgi:hypothetical protein
MIYVFAATIIYTLIKEKDNLFSLKRNLILFLLLTMIGIILGVIYLINPYLPSMTSILEKYMK